MKEYFDIYGPTYDPLLKQYFVKWKKESEEQFQFKFKKTFAEAEALVKEILKEQT